MESVLCYLFIDGRLKIQRLSTKRALRIRRNQNCYFQLAAQQGARAINNDNGSEYLYIKYIYFIMAANIFTLLCLQMHFSSAFLIDN